jgi:hypothetical protein
MAAVTSALKPPISRRRKRAFLLTGVAGALVVVVLASLTLTGTGWAPLAHWTCSRQALIAEGSEVLVPGVLVNSPYGGSAYGQGIGPSTFPGLSGFGNPTTVRVGLGVNASRGSAGGAFFPANVAIYHVANTLVAGPGSSSLCPTSPLQAVLSPSPQTGLYGAPVAVPSTTSDSGEASYLEHIDHSGSGTIAAWFNNGFSLANRIAVSTCGSSQELNLSFYSSSFNIGFNATWNGVQYVVSYSIPFALNFTYSFPADTGTWQVDNLSAPGGPGGGWAFAYQPCA